MTCTGRCRNRWHSTDCTTGPNYLKSTLGNGRVVWLSTDSSLAADGTSRYKAIQLYRQCLNSEPRCEPACKPEHLSMKTNSWWKKQTNKQTNNRLGEQLCVKRFPCFCRANETLRKRERNGSIRLTSMYSICDWLWPRLFQAWHV